MRFTNKLLLISLAAVPAFTKDVVLQRALPPSVAFDAKSFNVTAISQEAAGQPIASSFQELFKAKIQGDERFIYNDSNPALRMSITVTRYYSEPKQITGKNGCTTYGGNLQGSFRVIESDTGRPVASDTLGWMLVHNEAKHVLVSDDKREVAIEGPARRLTTAEIREGDGEASISDRAKTLNPLGRGGPCNRPFTENEARDALADVFLTDIVHMATPYKVPTKVKVPDNGVFRNPAEELESGRYSKAIDQLLAVAPQAKPADEAKRAYMTGIAYEGLGYEQGGRSNEVSEKIRADKSPAELDAIRAELRGAQDRAKDYLYKAAVEFKRAAMLDDGEKEYRAAERRADEANRLYTRIQKYRELKPDVPVAPSKPAGLSMPEITVMCQQGSSALIIVDRIERASEVPANILDQAAELAKCGDKQDRIYEALKKRLSTAKPAVVAVPAAAKAPAPTTAEAPAAPQAPPAPRAKPVAKAKPAAAAKPAPANAK